MEHEDATHEHDVFLSYARRDAPRIRALVEALEAEGLGVWWDTRIDAGSEFDRVIERHLAASRCVVVTWSEASIESEWVRTEAAEGLARGILVPVLLDDVQPPLAFRRRQALRLEDSAEFRSRIIASVRGVIETPADTGIGHLAVAPAASRIRRPSAPGVLALLATAALAAFLGWAARPTPAAAPLGITIALPGYEARRQAPYGSRPIASFALSRDGAHLAWIGRVADSPGDVALFVKEKETPIARRIANSSGAQTPVFSPDGEHLAFFAEGELRRARVAGGAATTVASVPEVVLGADWCEDDTILFSNGYRSPIRRVPASGGRIEGVTELAAGHLSHRHPRCGEDGTILFTLLDEDGSQLVAFLPEDRRLVELVPDAARGRRAGPGHLLFQRRDSIWSVPFDPATLAATGDADVLLEGTDSGFSISEHGDLLAELAVRHGDATLRVQRGETTFSTSDANVLFPAFSPSGRQIAVHRRMGASEEVWIHEATSGLPARQLTFEGGAMPIWSPDGRRILFWRRGTGLLSLELDGSRTAEMVLPSRDVMFPLQWTKAGLLYAELNPLTASDLLFRTNAGDVLAIDESTSATASGAISPDGRFIAYASDETGREELYVRRFPDGQTRWRVSRSGGQFPRWTANGRGLYFQAHDRILRMRVDTRGEAFEWGAPELVARLPTPGSFLSRLYDVTEDEAVRAFAEYERLDAPTLVLLTGLHERLRDRAP